MRRALLICLLPCGACTSTSDVTPMGRDTFMVGSQPRGGFISTADLAAMSVRKANDYCTARGKEMLPTNVENQGIRGFTPQENTLIFWCLDASDPENQRPVLRREPNAVIRIEP